MNDFEKAVIRNVCDGNLLKAQSNTYLLLKNCKTKKDEEFCLDMVRKLESLNSHLIELPPDLKNILIAEDSSIFPENRFLIRKTESDVITKLLSIYQTSQKLTEMGISYLPSLLLYGQSGCGKTMLARYIAYKANIPFVYVRFSSLIDSYLGSTQSNLAKIFDYVRLSPCVLCFDEIDAIGMERGQSSEIGEMARIVITLMQEIDRLPNNVILIGTTNRFNRLDKALVHRFSIKHEVLSLTENEISELAKKFFSYAGIELNDNLINWIQTSLSSKETANSVVSKCTDKIVKQMISHHLA